MKIVVNIGHPAHVHLFKNFVWQMERKGHEVLIVATKKDVALQLLDAYGFSYVCISSSGKSLAKKMLNLPLMDFRMYRAVRGFRPDIFIGVGSIRAAHVSRLMRKPCIVFDDTEVSSIQHMLYGPFTDAILTPACFKKDMGRKQVRYNGYHELAYLHPNYFQPDPSVLGDLGMREGDKFVVVRLVSYGATHDVGQHGFGDPREIVRALESYGRVIVTSERKLEPGLERCRWALSPERLHSLLYYASLYIGEGGTVATEAALLGTPAVRVSSRALHSDAMGNFEELETRYGLLYSFGNAQGALRKAREILEQKDAKELWRVKRQVLLNEKVDVTGLMIRLVEEYDEGFDPVRGRTPD